MNIDHFISEAVSRSVEALYGPLGEEQLQIQKTRKEFEAIIRWSFSRCCDEAASRPKRRPPR